jgi:hypothetical protein
MSHPVLIYNVSMDGKDASRAPRSPDRIGRFVLRGEFGPLLQAAMPECEIIVRSGETHVVAPMRDQAEAFGLLDRLRDLGAEILQFSIDDTPGEAAPRTDDYDD